MEKMRYMNQIIPELGYCLIIIDYFIYIMKQGKVNYWNQSSIGNFIHIEDIDFPNFSPNDANFPNSMGHGPIPKKGCESL